MRLNNHSNFHAYPGCNVSANENILENCNGKLKIALQRFFPSYSQETVGFEQKIIDPRCAYFLHAIKKRYWKGSDYSKVSDTSRMNWSKKNGHHTVGLLKVYQPQKVLLVLVAFYRSTILRATSIFHCVVTLLTRRQNIKHLAERDDSKLCLVLRRTCLCLKWELRKRRYMKVVK